MLRNVQLVLAKDIYMDNTEFTLEESQVAGTNVDMVRNVLAKDTDMDSFG